MTSPKGPAVGAGLAALAAIVAAHAGREGPLLEILHAVQAHFGHVPAWSVAPLAEALNLSRAEVHGVLTFYSALRTEPPPPHVLRLCRGEACLAHGGEALAVAPVAGRLAVETVYCLGNCACAPAAQLDGEVLGRLDARALALRLEALR